MIKKQILVTPGQSTNCVVGDSPISLAEPDGDESLEEAATHGCLVGCTGYT